ncbi:MAG: DNA methyltransferase [Thermodesulfobacteriota bacterium]
MKTSHKIIIGDSRSMKEIGDESVHLVITSPPYWQLKDYGKDGQIGFNDTYEDYINNLNLVWKECHRVLHKGCRICINIGDQFARSVYYGRYKVIPIRTEIIKFCENIGFDYMGAIIWQKVTTCNTTGGATIMGSFPYPRNGILKIDYEFILIFKKYGKAPVVNNTAKEKSRLTTEEWNQYFSGHWNFSGEKQDKHLAMFPEELPRRLIKMFSFAGDTVMDPFLGSGTTVLAAKKLERNSIGYEINEDFTDVIKEKIGLTQKDIFQDAAIDIVKREGPVVKFDEEVSLLPYIFRDPVKFDKKIDPKQLKFGSKIDKSSCEREEYFIVSKVVTPEFIELNNGLKIRLIGIKAREDTVKKAIDFLRKKLKGQRVFIKYDDIKYDEKGNLFCYLYLQNKTFINLHSIKSGLVDVDDSYEYKFKARFSALRGEVDKINRDEATYESKAYKRGYQDLS